jgi:uncharacterized protein
MVEGVRDGGTPTVLMTAAVLVLACGGAVSSRSDEDFNRGGTSSTGGSSGGRDAEHPTATGGSSSASSGSGGSGRATGGSDSASGGSEPSAGGAGPADGGDGGTGAVSTGGTATGGAAGSTAASTGGAGASPYAPRTGSFKMLAYSGTKGYRHASIGAGQKMLQDIGEEQGFEVTVADNDPTDPKASNKDITATGLEQYEIVFFMNPSGDVFNDTEEAAFEEWITTKNGAFAGVHSATDTENDWSFYQEMTGQYNDPRGPCCTMASIQWQSDALDFIAVRGLPNPWSRSEEWVAFSKYQDWSSKAGFKILSMVTPEGDAARPVSYVREWGNFRAFYTSLGHDSATFQDDNVKQHIAAGIIWAVRREALLKTN